MIGFESSGDWSDTRSWASRMLKREQYSNLDRYGREGVNALRSLTPKDTGLTADSWSYRVYPGPSPRIEWHNSNAKVAIMLQYGHGTGTGGYVEGRDYINPAIQPIFDKIADDVWRQVIR